MFFPVPYAYYDPNIVYRQTKIPDVVPIHRDTGHWDQGERQMACFDNKDYKDMRMNSDDFLKEQKSQERPLMQVVIFFCLISIYYISCWLVPPITRSFCNQWVRTSA